MSQNADAGELRRLPWRVGTKQPRNVYRGDEPIFVAPTVELAQDVVKAMNHLAAPPVDAPPSAPRRMMGNDESARMWGADNHAEEHDETHACQIDPICQPVAAPLPPAQAHPTVDGAGPHRIYCICNKGDEGARFWGAGTWIRQLTADEIRRLEGK